ncbi:hypothetical protein Lal_00027235 [Lupinus albus]|nr:hypothetical protein Lal_00027235 [Lupinus albus]
MELLLKKCNDMLLKWKILADQFPDIAIQISQTVISRNSCNLIWHDSNDGLLSLKAWRLFHNKIPSDENLKNRDSLMASMCSICRISKESFDHIFLSCPFAMEIWNWLGGIFSIPLDTSSFANIILHQLALQKQVHI